MSVRVAKEKSRLTHLLCLDACRDGEISSDTPVVSRCVLRWLNHVLHTCCVSVPVVILGARMQMKVMVDAMGKAKESFAKAGAIASEAISGVRTVAAFGLQSQVGATESFFFAGVEAVKAFRLQS